MNFFAKIFTGFLITLISQKTLSWISDKVLDMEARKGKKTPVLSSILGWSLKTCEQVRSTGVS